MKPLDEVFEKIKITDVKFTDEYDGCTLVFIEVDGVNKPFKVRQNIVPFLYKVSEKISEQLKGKDRKIFLGTDAAEKIIKVKIQKFIIERKMAGFEATVGVEFGEVKRGEDSYLIPAKIFHKEKEIEIIFSKYKGHRGILETNEGNSADTEGIALKIYNDLLEEREISFLTMGSEQKIFSQACEILKDIIVKKFKETRVYKLHCLYDGEMKEIFK